MANSIFQLNPTTGQPYTVDQAMQVGMPQGGGIGGGQPGMSGGLQDILVNRQGVGQMFGSSEPTGLAGLLGQQAGPDFAPVQGQPQHRKPNMLKNIGMGIFGGALDGVARWGGAQPGYANALEQQQQQALADQDNERKIALWREKIAAEHADKLRPQVEQIGNQFGILDPETGAFTPTYTAPDRVQTGEQERLIAAWQSEQDPTKKALIERAIRGYQYTPDALQQREESAIRVKQAIPGKAPSAPRSGGGITPTAAARYRAEAEAAISRGADPAQVRARLGRILGGN